MTGQISKNGINQTTDMTSIVSKYIDTNGQVTGKEKELEELFKEVNYYNSGSEGAADIQTQIDRLEAGIKALKDEAAALNKKIQEKNLKIDDKAKELADIVSDINDATSAHRESVKKAAIKATTQAITNYKANPSGFSSFEACFNETFEKKLSLTPVKNMNALKQLFLDYQNTQSSMSSVSGEIEKLLGDVSNLEGRLKNTNATANLLTLTKNNLATQIKDAYKNVDTDKNKAIYSGKKAEVADKILQTEYDSSIDFGDIKTQDTLQAEYLDKYKKSNPEGNKVDPYRLYVEGEEQDSKGRVGNMALNGFGEALDNGMWETLQESGMSCDEIMEWISTEWDVGLRKEDGKWLIPAGHGKSGHQEANKNYLDDATGSSKIYQKLTELYDKGDNVKTANSVSEENLSKLYSAMNPESGDDILTQMYKNGFTFKEAMCVVMDKFKDCGIEYKYEDGEQTNGRNYSMVKDSSISKGLYGKIASEIKQYWNVGSTDITTSSSDKIGTTPEPGDPITFRQGNTMYTFVNANDGKFDYNSESDNDLLGSKNGIQDLKDFDLDENDVIEGDELKNLTLMVNKQDESVGTQADVKKYRDGSDYKGRGAYTNAVDFNVSYTTAADLGITKIDLNTIQKGPGEVNSVAHKDVLNTFEIETDGKQLDSKITAQQTNDQKEYLKTFYDQIAKEAGKSTNSNKIYSAISNSDFNKAMSLDNPYNDDAAAAKSDIDSMKAYLKEAAKQAEAMENPELYELNTKWEEFQEMYGADGKGGTYLKDARAAAKNTAGEHFNDSDSNVNNEATDAVREEMNEFDEAHKVKNKKDEKKKDE